jgi:microcystin-dependent protein
MSKIHKWKKDREQKGHKGIKGDQHNDPKPTPEHAKDIPAPALPKSVHVTDLRVDEDLSLSTFDDLEPDQDFMITPSQPTVNHVYTVAYDPVSGKQQVAATDPLTIDTAPPDYSEVTSDGGTPSTPSVTLVSGPGWIKVKWGASTGTSDPLYYKVFMRLTSDPTTADDTYLVATTENLESVINKLTGGTQLSDASTYKVIVKAYSRISGGGTSADSTVATGSPAAIDASVTTISNLNAGNITTGTLSASFISSGTLSATVTVSGTIQTATSGARLVLDNTNGLRVFDGGATDYGAGAGVTVKLPISGDPFVRGTIHALAFVMGTDSGQSDVNSVTWRRASNSAILGAIWTGDNGSGTAPQMAIQVTPDSSDSDSIINLIASGDDDISAAGLSELDLQVFASASAAANRILAQIRDSVDPSDDETITVWNSRRQSDLRHIGEVTIWPTPASIPLGWLECDGTTRDIVDYPELFDALCPRIQSTITIASPGVITALKRDTEWGGQGHSYASGDSLDLQVNAPVVFSTTGALPTGLVAGTVYYVKTRPGADTLTVSATPGGAAINTTGSQSGTHYFRVASHGVDIGAGTFTLPDLSGNVPVGRDSGTFTPAGKTGGEETHALTTAELATHTHTFAGDALGTHSHTAGSLTTGNHTLNFRYSQNATLTAGNDIIRSIESQPASQGTATTSVFTHNISGSTQAVSAGTPSGTNANAGSGTAHNNLPPYLVVCYIILARIVGNEDIYTS